LPQAATAAAVEAAAAAAPAPPPASAAAAAGAAAAAAAAAAVAAAASAAADAPLLCWDPSGAALAALAPGGSAEAVIWLAPTGELQRVRMGPEGPVAAVAAAAAAEAAAAAAPPAATTTTPTITALAWLRTSTYPDLTLCMCSSAGAAQLYLPLRQLRAAAGASKQHPGGGGGVRVAAGLRLLKSRRPGVALADAEGGVLVMAGHDKRVTVSALVEASAAAGPALAPLAAFWFRGRPLRLAVAPCPASSSGGGAGRLAVALTTTKGALWIARVGGASAFVAAAAEEPMAQAPLPPAYGAPTALAWLPSSSPSQSSSSWPPPLAVGFESGHVLVLDIGGVDGSASDKQLAAPSAVRRLVRSSSIGGGLSRRVFGGSGGSGLGALDLAAAAASAVQTPPKPAEQQHLSLPTQSIASLPGGAVAALAHCPATGALAAVSASGAAALVPSERWRRRQAGPDPPVGAAFASTALGLSYLSMGGARAICASWSADGQLVAVGTTGGGGGSAAAGSAGGLGCAAAVFVACLPAVCAGPSTAGVVAYLSSLLEVAVAPVEGLREEVATAATGAAAAAAAPPTLRLSLECEPSVLAVGGGGNIQDTTTLAVATGHQAWFYALRLGEPPTTPPTTTTQQPSPPPPPPLLLRQSYPGRVLALALGGGGSKGYAVVLVSDGAGRRAALVHSLAAADGAAAPIAVLPPPLAQTKQRGRAGDVAPSSEHVTCLAANARLVVTGSSGGCVAFYLVGSPVGGGGGGEADDPHHCPLPVACVASWRHPSGEPLVAVSLQPEGVRAVAVDTRGRAFVVNAADGAATALEGGEWPAVAAAAERSSSSSSSTSVVWDQTFPSVFAVARVVNSDEGPPRLWARAYRLAGMPTATALAAAAAAEAPSPSPLLARVDGLVLRAPTTGAVIVDGIVQRAGSSSDAQQPLAKASSPVALLAGRLAVCGWGAVATAGGGAGSTGAPRPMLLQPALAYGGDAATDDSPAADLYRTLAAGGPLETRGRSAAARAAAAEATAAAAEATADPPQQQKPSAWCWRALAAASLDALDPTTAADALAEAGDARMALAASSLAAEEWTTARAAFALGLLLRLRPPEASADGNQSVAHEADAVERLLLEARRPCAALDMRMALGQWDRAVQLVGALEEGEREGEGGGGEGGGGGQRQRRQRSASAVVSTLPPPVRRRAMECMSRRAEQLEVEGKHARALELYASALRAADEEEEREQGGGGDKDDAAAGGSAAADQGRRRAGWTGAPASWSSSSSSSCSSSCSSSSSSDDNSYDNDSAVRAARLPRHQRACLSGLARCAARAGDVQAAIDAAERSGGHSTWRRLAAVLEEAAAGGGATGRQRAAARHAHEAALCHERAGDRLSAAAALVSLGDLEAAAPLMAQLAAAATRRRSREAEDDDGDEQQSRRLRELQRAYAAALAKAGRHAEAAEALRLAGDGEAAARMCWSCADAEPGNAAAWVARGCDVLRGACGDEEGGSASPAAAPAWLTPAALEAARRCLLQLDDEAADKQKRAQRQRAALEMLLLAGQDDRAFELAAARGLLPDVCDLLLLFGGSDSAHSRRSPLSAAAVERLARLARYLERCGDFVRAAEVWARAPSGGVEEGEGAPPAAATDAEAAEHHAELQKPPQPASLPVPWLVAAVHASGSTRVDGPARAVLLLLRRVGTAEAAERAVAIAGACGWRHPRPLLPPVLAALGLRPQQGGDDKEGGDDDDKEGVGGQEHPPLPAGSPLLRASSPPLPLLAIERLRVQALAAAGRRLAASRRALRAARREQARGKYKDARDLLLAAHLAVCPPATPTPPPSSAAAHRTPPPPPPPRELSVLLSLLHAYVLVRACASRGDHRSAALLLLRLAPQARRHFPAHAAALLTSGVIECRRSGVAALKGAAYGLAEQLARPEHRSSVPLVYKDKLARLLARGEGRVEWGGGGGGGGGGGDGGVGGALASSAGSGRSFAAAVADEPRAPCPCCGLLGPASQLDCAGCGHVVPYCIASGMRATLADEEEEVRAAGGRRPAAAAAKRGASSPSWSSCPRCRFPCRAGAMRAWLRASKGRCPMCDGEVAVDEIVVAGGGGGGGGGGSSGGGGRKRAT
jgi:hypothetical protein